MTPAQKSAAIVKELSRTGLSRLWVQREYKQYKAFLNAERKRVTAEIVKSTDTTVMSDLKSTMEAFAQGLDDFDKRVQPLIDALQQHLDQREGKTTGQSAGPAGPAAAPELDFDGVLDHTVTVRRAPLSLKTRYMML